jgi:hypothetical protein
MTNSRAKESVQFITEEQLKRAAIDPYYLWAGLEPEETLPYEIVHIGFARFIAAQRRCQWDALTSLKNPELLQIDAGLQAWSLYEATQRMAAHYRETYRACDFHELHFSEAMREGEELADPEWDALIAQNARLRT